MTKIHNRPIYIEPRPQATAQGVVFGEGKTVAAADCPCGAYYHPECPVPMHARRSKMLPIPLDFWAVSRKKHRK
jgi:hypothetical protein